MGRKTLGRMGLDVPFHFFLFFFEGETETEVEGESGDDGI